MISVLMGVNRVDEYLFVAIDSILVQQVVDFEFIIVANGPKANIISDIILKNYTDELRIIVIIVPIGQLSYALNVALTKARYEYIARMDADDIAHPFRLSLQLEYIKKTGCDMVGTAAWLVDANGIRVGQRRSPMGQKINWLLPFKNCFIHPSVMAKKEKMISIGGYNSGFNSEDYDLWIRMRRIKVKWNNMPEPLLEYRIHNSASQRRLLGYAETAGLYLREFIISKNPLWLLSLIIVSIKALILSR